MINGRCKKSISTFAATVVFFSTGGALAESNASPAGSEAELAAHAVIVDPLFDELDCESLGYVQPGEVDEHAGPIFSSFDIDKSFGISRAEWYGGAISKENSLVALSFEMADANSDTSLNFLEFTTYLKRAVSTLDSNGDGELSPAELQAYLPG